MTHATIIGASGAIGNAFVRQLEQNPEIKHILALSRSDTISQTSSKVHRSYLDLTDEQSVARAAERAKEIGPQHLIIVATGVLHDGDMMPEKSIRDLSADNFAQNFAINMIGPALVAKHFLPLMPKNERAIFAALSARVASLGDNRLGGWYAYRSAKAALNMLIMNLSIEMARTRKEAIIVGLHPGTVDSALSKPFQSRVPNGKLFTPDYSAEKLLNVINGLTVEHSGRSLAWDGEVIDY